MKILALALTTPLAALAARTAVRRSPRPRVVHTHRQRRAQPLPGLLRRACEAAQLDPPPVALLVAWPAGAAALAVLLAMRSGPVAGLGTGTALLVGPIGALVLLRGRRARAVDAELPVFLEAIARSLRTGTSPRSALHESLNSLTGPLRRDIEGLVRTIDLGAPLDAALNRWQAATASPAVALSIAALSLGGMAGGARARAVDNVAATLRERAALESEVASLTTQARASATVMALLPLGFLALTAAGDSDAASFLFTSPIGVLCLALGLGLDAVGAIWMVALTRSVR